MGEKQNQLKRAPPEYNKKNYLKGIEFKNHY